MTSGSGMKQRKWIYLAVASVILIAAGGTVALAQNTLYLNPNKSKQSTSSSSKDARRTLFLKKNKGAEIEKRRALFQQKYRSPAQNKRLELARSKAERTREMMEKIAKAQNLDMSKLNFKGPNPDSLEELEKVTLVYYSPKMAAVEEHVDGRTEAVLQMNSEFRAASRRIAERNATDRRNTRSPELEQRKPGSILASSEELPQQGPDAVTEEKKEGVFSRLFSTPLFFRKAEEKPDKSLTTKGGVYKNIRR